MRGSAREKTTADPGAPHRRGIRPIRNGRKGQAEEGGGRRKEKKKKKRFRI